MKKIYSYLLIFFSVTAVMAQSFPADGIGYQAMLSESSKVTYGTTLTNVPVANKDIQVRFELIQNGGVLLTDEHKLTTDINGIFSCIIGTGNVSPTGRMLSDINWGADSVLVRVNIDQGEGFELFSEQKLWSTAYAQFSNVARYASSDNDTSAINELQYLTLVGDSIKLTNVSGGISIKPLNDAIAQNTSDIAAEKNRAEASEQSLQSQITNIDNGLNSKGAELTAVRDSISAHRKDIDNNSNDISKSQTDITSNKTDIGANVANISKNTSDISINKTNISTNTNDISSLNDTAKVHRTEISKNSGAIGTNASGISQNKTDISSNRTNISTNTNDISNLKDTAKVHRTEISKNTAATNKNAADLAKHIADDKDLDNTNELTDLNYNSTAKELSLSNPLTTGNKIDLSGLLDNLGNHTATDTLNLNGQVLTDNSGDTLLIAVVGNDIDLALESEDEIFIRTINNPNNATNGDIKLESSDDVKIDAKTDIDIIGGDDVFIEALGDDLQLESSDDIKIYSGEDVFIQGQDKIEISSGGGENITIDSDNDIELKTTANDYVEIWTGGTFMYSLPNKRGNVGQFLQRSSDGSSEYFTNWSDYKLPTTDGSKDQVLVTDGSGNVNWGAVSGGANELNELKDVKFDDNNFTGSLLLGSTNTGTLNRAERNFGFGQYTYSKLTTGDDNVAIGSQTLQNLTTGRRNVAIGAYTQVDNLSGYGNVSMSNAALKDMTIGNQNVAIGLGAMQTADSCDYNVAIGRYALLNVRQGDNNIGLGVYAGSKINSGSNNIAFGTESMDRGNVTGDYNGALGYRSLYYLTEGSQNLAFGYLSAFNVKKGSYNIGIGSQAIYNVTDGEENIGIGRMAGGSITTGKQNVAIGISVMNNSSAITGRTNVGLGYYALNKLTRGSGNVAIGNSNLTELTSGRTNISIGGGNLGKLTTGEFNTVLGEGNLRINTSGRNNIVLGQKNMYSATSGGYNIILGGFSAYNATSAIYNVLLGEKVHYTADKPQYTVGIGYYALYNHNGGDGNVAIGREAAIQLSSGSDNTIIGQRALGSAGRTGTAYQGNNNTVIGYNAMPSSTNVSNEITLGNGSITKLRCAVTSITSLSDRRDKKNIRDLESGIDFLMKVRPVTYDWNTRDKSKVDIPAAGFIAQELLEAQESTDEGENLDLVEVIDENKMEARYANLLPVIVKSIQQQQRIIEEQQKLILSLQAQLKELSK